MLRWTVKSRFGGGENKDTEDDHNDDKGCNQ
jgi:hypothetical protein